MGGDIIVSAKVEFSQDIHSCANSEEHDEGLLSIQLVDAGGGPYIVINATEWAIDKAEDTQIMRDVLECFWRIVTREHGSGESE